ncbi:hypothetical protein Syun_015357 [Stephania yunnanensis]|uniref:Uncharacterized protein n=1 Tax=Stephania yunnanensis TaxID=152371 RepID=A0AAP0P9M7_9MAGN
MVIVSVFGEDLNIITMHTWLNVYFGTTVSAREMPTVKTSKDAQLNFKMDTLVNPIQ